MYKHLSRQKRIELAILVRTGHSLRQAAKILAVSPSTVSRELKRNRCFRPYSKSKYHAGDADRLAKKRRREANQRFIKIRVGSKLDQFLEDKIAVAKWSPEQIAGWMKRNKHPYTVSHQTIYDWIYRHKPELRDHLHCRKGKYRRTRANKIRKDARDKLAAARHISRRPKRVENRKTCGHWEGDTVVGAGRSGYIATLTERKSGYLMARTISKSNFSADNFAEAAISSLKDLPDFYKRTITLDNGPEMKSPEKIERGLNIKVYYATPYHSWERGTNENTNGLLRYFFSKKMRFDNITQKDLDRAVKLINNRPRKRLNWRTPADVFKFKQFKR